MNLNSRIFDRIRVSAAKEAAREATGPRCQHPGCAAAGEYRAPKGRAAEGEYWRFCLDHVREYNKSYNYFAGMSDDAVMNYQKAAATGHRPTWSMGVNGATRDTSRRGATDAPYELHDAFGLFHRGFEAKAREEAKPKLSATALKALDTLGVEEGADAAAIKARYKLLVKKFHPDANGGDRSYEARLQEIIRAYGTLKSIGMA